MTCGESTPWWVERRSVGIEFADLSETEMAVLGAIQRLKIRGDAGGESLWESRTFEIERAKVLFG